MTHGYICAKAVKLTLLTRPYFRRNQPKSTEQVLGVITSKQGLIVNTKQGQFQYALEGSYLHAASLHRAWQPRLSMKIQVAWPTSSCLSIGTDIP